MNLQKLMNHEWVISVYEHIIADEQVPIVIVTDDAIRRCISCNGLSRIIVLTQEEVKDSHDVFALQFVYMLARAQLIAGKDVLKKIRIDRWHLRRHIELLLRQMIIDWRELELVHNKSIWSYERKSVHDRLGVWLAKLLKKKEENIRPYIDALLWTNLESEETHEHMYENYLMLLEYVDTLELKEKKSKKIKKTKKSKDEEKKKEKRKTKNEKRSKN